MEDSAPTTEQPKPIKPLPKRKRLGKWRKNKGGFFRTSCGFERQLDGSLKRARFYLAAPDEATAQAQKERLFAEWTAEVAAGFKYWRDETLDRLLADRVIRRTSTVSKTAAVKAIGEPLNKAELAPYLDETGTALKPEVAVVALEHGTRKTLALAEVRARFFEDLYEALIKEPIATYERCARMFGWSKEQTSAFLFNVTGSMSVSPLAYDASADRGKAADALVDAGILAADPPGLPTLATSADPADGRSITR